MNNPTTTQVFPRPAPGWALTKGLGTRLGRWVYRHNPRFHRCAEVNYDGGVGPQAVERYHISLVDAVRAVCLGHERMAQDDQIVGAEHLMAALAEGRGVVLASAHHGSPLRVTALASKTKEYKIGGQAYKIRLASPAKRFVIPVWDWVIRLVRWRLGVELIPIMESGQLSDNIKALKTVLAENGVVGMLVDLYHQGAATEVTICNRQTKVSTWMAGLVLASGAVLLPAASYYEANGSVTLYIGPPVEIAGRKCNSKNREELTQKFWVSLNAMLSQDQLYRFGDSSRLVRRLFSYPKRRGHTLVASLRSKSTKECHFVAQVRR